MQLSNENTRLLKSSISLEQDRLAFGKDHQKQKESSIDKLIKTVDKDFAFVQTNKNSHSSGIKLDLGENLSGLVEVEKSIQDMKNSFETINEALLDIDEANLAGFSKTRQELILEQVSEIKSVINNTKVGERKVFLSDLKIKVNSDQEKANAYKGRIYFAKDILKLKLSFDDLAKEPKKVRAQFDQVRTNIERLNSLNSEISMHKDALHRQMERFLEQGDELAFEHFNSKFKDHKLVNSIRLKSSGLFDDFEELISTQARVNAQAALNFLPVLIFLFNDNFECLCEFL